MIGRSYSLVPLRHEDMPQIKEWRNEQLSILRQKEPLSDEDQERYWVEVVEPSQKEDQPKQLLYSIILNDKCIGYGGIVHIDWEAKRGEVSFLLDPTYSHIREAFLVFLQLIFQRVSEKYKLHKLTTETYDIRPEIITILEESGFELEGRLRDHVLIDGNYVDSLIHGVIL